MAGSIQLQMNRFPHILVYSTSLAILSLAVVAIVSSLII
jgi:hypothetical protein